MLKVKTKAPDFCLLDQDGKQHKLSDYKGKKVILYFYPKDNTPGCTMQACSYRDNITIFSGLNIEVLGISKDSVASHKKFQEKYGLPFTLLADEDLETIKKYDVLKEKSMFGNSFLGIKRTTYLIDENGIIVFASDKVEARNDALNMLKVIEEK